MKNRRGLFVFVLLLCAAPCFAAVDAFLKIDGIKGESTDTSHKDWIEISSFSWGMSRAIGGVGGVTQGCATNEIHFSVRGAELLTLTRKAGAPQQSVALDVNGQHHVLEGATLSCQNNLCVMKFQRCSTHAATLTQPNGQLLLGNNPAETLTVVGLSQQSPNGVVLSARGASPSLMLKCANGKHYDNVKIVCRKAGGTQQEFLTFTMHDVIITSYRAAGDGSTSIGMKYAMADGSARSFQDLH